MEATASLSEGFARRAPACEAYLSAFRGAPPLQCRTPGVFFYLSPPHRHIHLISGPQAVQAWSKGQELIKLIKLTKLFKREVIFFCHRGSIFPGCQRVHLCALLRSSGGNCRGKRHGKWKGGLYRDIQPNQADRKYAPYREA